MESKIARSGIIAFVWYWASWLPHMVVLTFIISHPPTEIHAGDIGLFIGMSSLTGWVIFLGGIWLTESIIRRHQKKEEK